VREHALAKQPEARREQAARVHAARSAVQAIDQRLADSQKRRRVLDREIVAYDEQLHHFEKQLLSVTTQHQLEAMQHEIAAVRAKRDVVENEALERLDAEERDTKARPEKAHALERAESEASATVARLDAEAATHKTELATLEARRGEIAGHAAAGDALALREAARRARGPRRVGDRERRLRRLPSRPAAGGAPGGSPAREAARVRWLRPAADAAAGARRGVSVPEPPRGFRVAASLPYRRIALVLSGGGALGAYEIGVLRVLETLRLVPSLVVGVSIGAVNAVAWLVAGRDAGPIEHVWRTARGETLGVQWVSLALRIAGTFIAMMALLEAVLTLIGSDEFSGARWFWRHQNPEWDLLSTQLDALCWFGATVFGGLAVFFARRIAAWLDRHANVGPPEKARKRLLVVTCTAAAVHMIVGFMGWPWPHRFSAAVVILLAVVWTASAPGSIGRWSRNLALGLMPETGGRGLWSGRARRRILENLVTSGDAGKLVGTGTGLVVSALALDRGVVTHFVSWPEVDEGFERRIHDELGEVVHLKDATEVISAALASSAIPGIFQPESVRGREFVDAGGFTNQPLHVAIARDVDAARRGAAVAKSAAGRVEPSGRGRARQPAPRARELARPPDGASPPAAGMEPRGRAGARVRGRAAGSASHLAAPVRSRARRGADRRRPPRRLGRARARGLDRGGAARA
jgi:predicted acylesterase/phospholipase RssA